ncbi:MAG TPA: GDYXXLXY domain-containing protein [Labilithrix sp.]|nr:GDYXXLXY domain-containing protein [Labilithrix sp.]
MSLPWVKRVLLAMALVDLLVFGGWIAREETARSGELVHLPIDGYDPRDLLSGHYVQFRLAAERETQALPHADGDVSACLERGEDGLLHVTHLRLPGEACTFVTGSAAPYRIDFGVDRFYVDERRASEVGRVVAGPTTYLVATIDAAGTIHPIDLVVSGTSMGAPR